MEIAISGSSGLIGRALLSFLQGCGHTVKRLVRDKEKGNAHTIFWDPERGEIALEALEGVDAIVNLAGDGIAGARWTKAKKQAILTSRVNSAKILNDSIGRLNRPPKVFLSASAVGYYGDNGDAVCTEETPSGQGFLSEVCRHWEEAAMQPQRIGTRTVLLRFGIVLSTKGGALAKMLPAFRWGFGGVLGSGKQYMSWIAIEDVMAIILFAIMNSHLEGPVNVAAPFPVTNAEFTQTLGKAQHRPAFFFIPAPVLRLLMGKEMANELLLTSTQAYPAKLMNTGYRFLYPSLEPAMEVICN